MKIEQIHIDRFAGMTDRTFSFGEGINLIEGKNEAGKSTLCAFIRFMLYGFSDKTKRNLYLPWDADFAGGSMIVLGDDHCRYRIERQSGRSGRGNVTVFRLPAEVKLPKDTEPWRMFLGLPEELFIRSAFVGQIDGAGVGGGDVSRAIERLLFSADESTNIDWAMKRLDAARTQLRHKRGDGGKLAEMEAEQTQLRQRLQAANDAQGKIFALQNDAAAYREKIKACQDGIETAREAEKLWEEGNLRQRYRTYEDCRQTVLRAERELSETKRCFSVEEFLPDSAFLTQLRDAASKQALTEQAEKEAVQACEYARQNIPKPDTFPEKESMEQDRVRAVNGAKQKRLLQKGLLLCAALTLFFGACLALRLFRVPPFRFLPIVVPAALTGIAVAFCVLCTVLRVKKSWQILALSTRYGLQDGQTLDMQLDKIHDYRDLIKRRTEEYEQQCQTKLQRESDARRAQSDAAALYGRVGSADAASAIRFAERAIQEVTEKEAAYRQACAALDTAKALLEPYDPVLAEQYANTPFDAKRAAEVPIAKVRADLVQLQYDLKDLQGKLQAVELQLTKLQASTELPATIQTLLEANLAQCKQLQMRCDAYQLAYEKLQDAGVHLRESLSPRLSKSAGELLGSITGGKYTELRVAADLCMRYSTEAGGVNMHDLVYLSSGTQDAAYIALRIALMRLLMREKVPMFFDESFARMDDTRLDAMLRILASAALGGAQLFLFTSQTRDAALLAPVASFETLKLS